MRVRIKDVKLLTAFVLFLPLISIAAFKFFIRAREQMSMPKDMWE